MQPKFQYPRRSRFAPQCEDDVNYSDNENIYRIEHIVNRGSAGLSASPRPVKIPLSVPLSDTFPLVIKMLATGQR